MSELIQKLQSLLGPGGVLLGEDISSRPANWRGGNPGRWPLFAPATHTKSQK